MLRFSTLILALIIAMDVNAQSPPNIILILADDQGWNGTSVQMDPELSNSKSDFYETPNLERLASSGMRFSQAYAPSPKCSPSRMSILTGKTTARNRFTETSSATSSGEILLTPASNTSITDSELTLPEYLKSLSEWNYRTGHFGKWHLGQDDPTLHGFDESDVEESPLLAYLRSCLKSLNEADKAIMTLYLEELRYKEIAQIIGLTENYVAVKVKRIKTKLLNCINDKS